MIAKMKFVNITGPKKDIDRVAAIYLTKYPIHLENALSELKDSHVLTPFIEDNPYKETVGTLTDMAKLVNQGDLNISTHRSVTLEDARELIEAIQEKSESLNRQKLELEEKKAHINELLEEVKPFKEMNFPISTILNYHFIKYRFGRIALNYYDTFSKYVYDNLNTIFYESSLG